MGREPLQLDLKGREYHNNWPSNHSYPSAIASILHSLDDVDGFHPRRRTAPSLEEILDAAVVDDEMVLGSGMGYDEEKQPARRKDPSSLETMRMVNREDSAVAPYRECTYH